MVIVFLILFSFIKAQEAERQHVKALVQAEIAKKNAEEASMQAELAAQQATLADAHRLEAETQRQLALEAQAELAKCSGKK